MIVIVCALIGLFVLAVIGGSVLAVSELGAMTGNNGAGTEAIYDSDEPGRLLPNFDDGADVIGSDREEQMYIGSDELGYVRVDTFWRQIDLADGDTNGDAKGRSLYKNGNYYITIVDEGESGTTPMMKVNEWRDEIIKEGAEHVELAFVEMGQLSAQQLKGYYRSQNIWTMTWMFETDDGHLRHITVEGPSKTSRFFAIPNTYSLVK